MIKYLLSKASTGKFRVAYLEWDEEWDFDRKGFVIKRSYGQLRGKITQAPDIVITIGKAGRTHREQTLLQFNSELKKYLDKGYKELERDPETYTEAELNELYGDLKTDTIGIVKPMLAKQYQDVSASIFNKDYYGSRKINGVRCLLYYKDGEIHTRSRGSISYDLVMNHIIKHPKLISYLKNNPELILDGEIYKFGLTLNKISGICRSQKTAYDGEFLEYYLYDIVDTNKSFEERLEIINNFKNDLNLGFNPEKEWNKNELKIQIVPQVSITGWDNIKSLHDTYVSEGWEGLVIRLKSDVYHPGNRGNYMIKIKEYFEKEYEIVGISEGLREEDMCFIMKTESGLTFNAKPIGDRLLKQEYRKNIEKLIGKMASIKYFEMSGTGSDIPQQPIFLGVRDYE